jgi:hypothetical protein
LQDIAAAAQAAVATEERRDILTERDIRMEDTEGMVATEAIAAMEVTGKRAMARATAGIMGRSITAVTVATAKVTIAAGTRAATVVTEVTGDTEEVTERSITKVMEEGRDTAGTAAAVALRQGTD